MTKDEALDLALEALETWKCGYPRGWDAFDEEAITAIKQARSAPNVASPPVQSAERGEPVAWHDKIIGMEVSMDVSTGEDDIDHRVYGQVYEVMLAYDGGPDVILAIESERNFTTPPAQPAPAQSCYCPNCEEMGKELAALKAQPVQEPVAWYDSESGVTDFHSFKPVRKPNSPTAEWLPPYTTPPAQPANKNDGGAVMLCGAVVTNVYDAYDAGKKAAAKRQWVGLDDDDISALGLSIAKAKALESLLKRRNT
jgi:hypothetical protein